MKTFVPRVDPDTLGSFVGGRPACALCKGFTCEQLEPGIWTICRACCGSSIEGIKGDRTPGMVVRNSRLDMEETAQERSTRNAKTGPKPRSRPRGPRLRTHCPHGHEYTPENTVVYGKERGRRCRICVRARARDKHARDKAAAA